jgi:hypothetical protein
MMDIGLHVMSEDVRRCTDDVDDLAALLGMLGVML